MLVNDPSLTPQEQRLRDLMIEISEASYSAGWMLDTEFEVWRLATEGGAWAERRLPNSSSSWRKLRV